MSIMSQRREQQVTNSCSHEAADPIVEEAMTVICDGFSAKPQDL